jgi:hypothetical protein
MTQHPAHAQNHRHPDEPRPEEIEEALKGANYPSHKDALLRTAEENGANGEIMRSCAGWLTAILIVLQP